MKGINKIVSQVAMARKQSIINPLSKAFRLDSEDKFSLLKGKNNFRHINRSTVLIKPNERYKEDSFIKEEEDDEAPILDSKTPYSI